MSIVEKVQNTAVKCLTELYKQEFNAGDFQVNQTKEEFEGDYTVVLFSLLKKTAQNPQSLGEQLGNAMVAAAPETFTGYNIIKGFLNLSIADTYWLQLLKENYADPVFGIQAPNGKKVMVEYSSPNTNKPLHLGHLRNNFLGWSVAEILKANGYEVFKSCIVNDRGIHICKSMISWEQFANGETPES
ncbi:MAG: arginine--tRNA ligase, partial [Sphingobacteriales bacterium]